MGIKQLCQCENFEYFNDICILKPFHPVGCQCGYLFFIFFLCHLLQNLKEKALKCRRKSWLRWWVFLVTCSLRKTINSRSTRNAHPSLSKKEYGYANQIDYLLIHSLSCFKCHNSLFWLSFFMNRTFVVILHN